jgi:hypothetical protein
MSDRENILSALRREAAQSLRDHETRHAIEVSFFVNEGQMCNLYSITMNQAAIRDQFKVVCTIPLAR